MYPPYNLLCIVVMGFVLHVELHDNYKDRLTSCEILTSPNSPWSCLGHGVRRNKPRQPQNPVFNKWFGGSLCLLKFALNC